ncbi:MAG: iron ABC transporter permease [Desulfurococcales archaeon]|nr:iron ABC transporter permease [Desulfurococcales archaeon]
MGGQYSFFAAYTITLCILLALLSLFFLEQGYGNSELVKAYRSYRIVYAIAIGAILSISGSFLQSSLRNPLVDYYILGVGGGAVFGLYTYLAIVNKLSLIGLTLSASIGGLLALSLTMFIAEAVGGSDIAYVLAGMGVSAFFSGISILLSYIVVLKTPIAAFALIGSLIAVSRSWMPIILSSIMILSVLYIVLAKPLNAIIIGDDYAAQLGYNPRLYRFIAVVSAGVASAMVVACCGTIGFLGLVAPHLARLLIKSSDNRFVIPLSALLGSTILLIADNISRIYLSTKMGEVPAGALVSILGSIFFIIMLVRRLRRGI